MARSLQPPPRRPNVLTSHALAALADEGCDQLFAIDEILVAWRDDDVQRDRRHAGRWVAFGTRLAVVLEIDDHLCVVTVFEARLG